MNYINTIITWIFTSSADPEKWSLMVKAALLGVVPAAIQAIGLACGFHIVCLAVSGDDLNTLALSLTNLVYLGLSFVAAALGIIGFVRKVYLTVLGENRAFPKN